MLSEASENSPNNLRQAALLSLLLFSGAAAALALASYLAKSPRVALSAGSDGASIDEWLRKAADSLKQTRQRLVEDVDRPQATAQKLSS